VNTPDPQNPAQPPTKHNVLTASGDLDAAWEHTELRLPGGHILHVPTAFLLRQAERAQNTDNSVARDGSAIQDSLTIPVIEEHLHVGKRTVTTGKVVLQKHTQEHAETLDVPLAVRTFDIERVILNQTVETPPPVRQEGDTTIYSLVEEQLVITKKLLLKEEVRVTRRDTERRDTRTVTLQRETLTVTRTPISGKDSGKDRSDQNAL